MKNNRDSDMLSAINRTPENEPTAEEPAKAAARSGAVSSYLVKGIGFYQRKISPHLPTLCRFYPSCSCYAIEALEVHGAFWGSLLAVKRILKCNPLFPGGVDPVPPSRR